MKSLSFTKHQIYENNIGILKYYTDQHYKLIGMKAVRIAGFEKSSQKVVTERGTAGNSIKLDGSLSRSRRIIFELALCNPWTLFVTMTINGAKNDRNNLKAFFTVLAKWINNMNYQQKLNIRYLIIPEPHKDNAWHFHGLMMGIPFQQLKPFNLEDNIPEKTKRKIRQGRKIMNWMPYCEKFGWVTVEQIISHNRCAKYMMKYVTKKLMESRIELNHHVFYASKHLRRAEVICRAPLRQSFEPSFQNDYVRTKDFNNAQEPLQYFFEKENLQ